MTCEDCGLPDNRQRYCDRWKCPIGLRHTADLMYTFEAVLAGTVRADSPARVFGVVAGGRDDLSANLDAVPRLRWVFGVPDALRGFQYDILRARITDRDA